MRLHECLKRCFFTQRALSDSPVEASGSSNPTEQALGGRVRTGDEDEEHVDLPDVSPFSAFLHREEPITDTDFFAQ